MNIFYFPSLCLDTFSVNLNSQNASFRRSMSLSYLKYYRDKNPSFYYCAKAVCCDCRILLIVFQKAAFQDANVCLFVFDCIYFNDVSLMDRCVCGRGEFWESPAMQTDQFSWAVTLGRSGQRGRDLAVEVPVELLLLSVLALAASQLLVLHPLNTLVTLGIPFYHFLEESKS